jgi:hypothetical protein
LENAADNDTWALEFVHPNRPEFFSMVEKWITAGMDLMYIGADYPFLFRVECPQAFVAAVPSVLDPEIFLRRTAADLEAMIFICPEDMSLEDMNWLMD